MNFKKIKNWSLFLFALVPVGVLFWTLRQLAYSLEYIARFIFKKIVDRYYNPLDEIKEVYNFLKNENEKEC